ncbi:UDP-4-amino-4,6-dideoxy-N-acetyl-beta-L-altrosamine transaminase [Malaciobacter canalis]|uniref:UDP-4-amino-4,6-dideoxy-N-acetyl-beta-L-altrosamine transaminase n=1 Tax=Malaciobacter canalis TaxID=1912871 RepID=A0ABX4LQ25_9BACT|nr:UDP-4-amino-4,6-dideoxy-N-acetyl-beta-L-altrosamine transaminase [Malaciobacter canalis]PHO09685.1 UDP-4-amino-4,6-dideoxy-N-acetyl-beta-L-altrosamine transaminase [Malaciobacter canalis]QEE34105.1 UDP-2-acetamido-2,6-dideoxy-beta-L-arabino-hex-4-ulose aminotransferase [Malaciobacter canalis]
MKKIPYGKQTIQKDDIKEVVKVLKSDFLTTGPKVKEFEKALCSYTNSKYCVCVSNATAALHISSLLLLNENDLVLTTPNSFLATSNAILYAKAKPVFVDICEDGNINLDLCEKLLLKNKNIKAIYVVHFSGNPVNQGKLAFLREKYDIKILEDCAHSIGATNNNIKAGSCKNSDISVFSFHPVKQLTTGEGGAILTNDKKIYEMALQLRNHGIESKSDIAPWHYEMNSLGYNYRLTDISCALGLSQLKKIEKFINKRRKIANRYDEFFKKFEFIKPLYEFTLDSSYHLYVVLIDFEKYKTSKKDLFLKLREKGIFLQYHYIPINQQPYYKNLGYGNENTPFMNEYYKKAITLPIYPKLSKKEQKFVQETLIEILEKG